MAGIWASRLGVHVWEPRVMRASVPDRRWRVGTSLCPLPPAPRCWGQTWGMCARMCTRVDVHTEAWISVCMPMSEYAHSCVYVACVCAHVYMHAPLNKCAYTHELHCVSTQGCAQARVHICMWVPVNKMCGSGVGLCAPTYLVCEHAVCSCAHVWECVGVHV